MEAVQTRAEHGFEKLVRSAQDIFGPLASCCSWRSRASVYIWSDTERWNRRSDSDAVSHRSIVCVCFAVDRGRMASICCFGGISNRLDTATSVKSNGFLPMECVHHFAFGYGGDRFGRIVFLCRAGRQYRNARSGSGYSTVYLSRRFVVTGFYCAACRRCWKSYKNLSGVRRDKRGLLVVLGLVDPHRIAPKRNGDFGARFGRRK